MLRLMQSYVREENTFTHSKYSDLENLGNISMLHHVQSASVQFNYMGSTMSSTPNHPTFQSIPIGIKFKLSKHNQDTYRKTSSSTAINLTHNRTFYFKQSENVYIPSTEWNKVEFLWAYITFATQFTTGHQIYRFRIWHQITSGWLQTSHPPQFYHNQ